MVGRDDEEGRGGHGLAGGGVEKLPPQTSDGDIELAAVLIESSFVGPQTMITSDGNSMGLSFRAMVVWSEGISREVGLWEDDAVLLGDGRFKRM